MKKISIVAIIILIAVVACEKKERIVENDPSSPAPGGLPPAKNQHPALRLLSDWDDAANSSNPADSAGLIHNMAVDYVVSTVSTSDPASRAYDSTIAFANSYFGSSFDESDFRTKISITMLEDLLADSTSYWHNSIDDLRNFGKPVKDKLKDLVDILVDTTSLPADVPYDTIKAHIVAWETVVSGSTTLSASDKSFLLHVSSVARFSMLYWIKKHNDEWDLMTPAERAATTKKRKWWQWLIIGVVDAAGVVAGAVIGNVPAGISAGAGASNVANTLMQ